MTLTTIKNQLMNHGVSFKEENGQIFAFEAWWDKDGKEGGQWVNVTSFSKEGLGVFLGY